MESSLGRTV